MPRTLQRAEHHLLKEGRVAGDSHYPPHYLPVGEDGQRTMMIKPVCYPGELLKQDGQGCSPDSG